MKYELVHGDCIEVLREMESDSVDSIVTDPPYGLSFMAKKWDYDVPSVKIWRECLRVLKPGGHLLSFAGSRTYHRMAVNIEDAGFEIRDQVMWVYGSGFPKSQNISKAIDKKGGEDFAKRPNSKSQSRDEEIYALGSELAKQWEGWGTALKPAHEPIVVARKPLIGTIVENVLEHGTGGLNIYESRIEGGRFPANIIHDGSEEVLEGFPETRSGEPGIKHGGNEGFAYGKESREPGTQMTGFGDSGSAARFFYCAKASKAEKDFGLDDIEPQPIAWSNQAKAELKRGNDDFKHDNDGTKHNKVEYRKNIHPTVKPVALMKYLCRLITPTNGVVLDPFMGSGTTGIGATTEGFSFIGIEREEEYINIARHRISHWTDEKEEEIRQHRMQKTLFEFGRK